MRVIHGKYKGKRLFAPQNDRVRPTTDRVKETLFNILYSRKSMEQASVLDLFCGSGALGIEALSRGAKRVVFVDQNTESIALTKKNLAHVGAFAEVYTAHYASALKKLQGSRFDFVFLDPPYGAGVEQNVMQLILKNDILSQQGIIILEHDAKNGLQNHGSDFIIDKRTIGQTGLTFLIRAEVSV